MVKNFEDMITRFDRIHERDRRTDRQTPHDGACMHRVAKNHRSPPEPRLSSVGHFPGPISLPT